MKRSKFADKITDYVEDTLLSLGHSPDFTIYDNLDTDEFSITLEHDDSGRRYSYGLEELYNTKQEEDVKVKDLYRDNIKDHIIEFVESIVRNRTEDHEVTRVIYDHDDIEEDTEDYEEDDYEEEDDYNDYEDDEKEDDYYDDLDEEEEEDEEEIEEPFGRREMGSDHFSIISANSVLPVFLRGAGMDKCLFVTSDNGFSKEDCRYPDSMTIGNVIDRLGTSEPLFSILDENTMVFLSGIEKDYFKDMLKSLGTEGGVYRNGSFEYMKETDEISKDDFDEDMDF